MKMKLRITSILIGFIFITIFIAVNLEVANHPFYLIFLSVVIFMIGTGSLIYGTLKMEDYGIPFLSGIFTLGGVLRVIIQKKRNFTIIRKKK